MDDNNQSEPANDTVVTQGSDEPRRRIQDRVMPKDPVHKLNLDRRVKNSDRRKNSDPNYSGLSRRYTIDRRVNVRDRRQAG